MLLLPVILILQMVLASGGVFPDFGSQPGLKQASYFASAQWGFAGVAATADLNELQKVSTLALEFPIVDLTDPAAVGKKLLEAQGGPNRYSHDTTAWMGAAVALTILTAICLVATALVLRRHDGG